MKRVLPAGQFETYSYNNGGNLQNRTDFNGKTTTFNYDVMRRLLSKVPDASLNQPTISFTYNANGQRATMNDASGASVYNYDGRNRLASKQTPFGTLSYTYDDAGNLLTTRSSNANGTSVDYTYDPLNRLATVKDNNLLALNGGVTTYNYDTVGNLKSYLYPNGVTTTYNYNSLNRLSSMNSATGVSTLSSYTYTLGAAGNRTAVTELGGRTVNYTYDDLYRLTNETIANDTHGINGTVTYGYDAVGNRLVRTSSVAGVPTQTSTYDANDRLTSDTYDANGNTKVSSGGTYDYDFENRLITHTASITSGFVYDGDGNRVAKTVGEVTTNYLVDTNNHTGYAQVVEELQSGAVVKQFTYGHDLISQRCSPLTANCSLSFYGYDGHGSVRLLTDATASVTDTYAYDAFGNLIYRSGTTPNDYLYSGEQLDANLVFYYLRARYMNPQEGRFVSVDTYEGRPAEPGSLHKYLYGNANPINRTDPSGHYAIADKLITMAIMTTLVTITAMMLIDTLPKIKVEIDIYELPRVAPLPPPLPAPSPGPVPLIPPQTDDDRQHHRGSIQAQGDGIWFGQRTDLGDGVSGDKDTISWKWSQGFPLSLFEGLAGLTAVESKLSRSQLRVRDEAFMKARRFIATAAAAGGAPPKSYRFQNGEVRRRRGNERVDIVVNSGVAFVP